MKQAKGRSRRTEIFRVVLAIAIIIVGITHFTHADQFARIVPPPLPAYPCVYISGVFEILGGVGLLIPFVSVAAAWGLIALFVAVFPANIYQALNSIAIDGIPHQPLLYWFRLPFQAVLIGWAWLYTRKPEQQPGAAEIAAAAESQLNR
ncbi:MAG TPA: DoxX family membrane protein [Thermosynechococcaceae cyanobacterium]